MIYSVIDIPQELFAPAAFAHYEGEYELAVLKAGPDLYSFAEPLSWSADITNTGDALLVQGEVEGTARTACARCLEPVDIDLLGEIEGYFVLDGETHPEDLEDDEFSLLPADHRIDLEPLMKAGLLLDVPYVPLCDDDCKGICPECGANLNEGDCGCSAKADDEAMSKSPFAALKDLHLGE